MRLGTCTLQNHHKHRHMRSCVDVYVMRVGKKVWISAPCILSFFLCYCVIVVHFAQRSRWRNEDDENEFMLLKECDQLTQMLVVNELPHIDVYNTRFKSFLRSLDQNTMLMWMLINPIFSWMKWIGKLWRKRAWIDSSFACIVIDEA